MVRTHGRILIGFLACLLMQAGLLISAFPVSAQAHSHPAMAGCHDMAPTHCTPSPHVVPVGHAHHQDPCCHVHLCASDLSSPAPVQRLGQPPGVNTQAFGFHEQVRPVGGDWLPPLRPPKFRNG
ncbi:hypothetical protein [Komagataeibacter sp. FNDCR2]|uniref:hypothetical protein n=1 Tax=Komagataeibacter sp. FNDCR2 TaxID=2878682 RepID=UPI001E5BA86E|nr:hypothetical protein [Komagataeibacter sp. FNDCR2]MCE2574240.1 hypothetical protein [Komagataeibacter sp. FNDCR2]